ncbi:hypothetical protein BRAS3809_7990020 [Bradyrhizobium sp. STM 3809]|nr:hypothetical protein BRAS3809_7990020 [Bradyrhizobium sp. STM 3809]
MPGLVPPARPKPLRRGEGPEIDVVLSVPNDVDGRDTPGHDDVEADARKTPMTNNSPGAQRCALRPGCSTCISS